MMNYLDIMIGHKAATLSWSSIHIAEFVCLVSATSNLHLTFLEAKHMSRPSISSNHIN